MYWSGMMNFSEYALFLCPLISKHDKYDEYFVELFENFISEDKWLEEDLLDKEPDTLYRYISNSRKIPKKLAIKLNANCDIDRFTSWIDDRIAESNSHETVYKWLVENGIDNREVSTACANLLKDIINDIASNNKRNSKHKIESTSQNENVITDSTDNHKIITEKLAERFISVIMNLDNITEEIKASMMMNTILSTEVIDKAIEIQTELSTYYDIYISKNPLLAQHILNAGKSFNDFLLSLYNDNIEIQEAEKRWYKYLDYLETLLSSI